MVIRMMVWEREEPSLKAVALVCTQAGQAYADGRAWGATAVVLAQWAAHPGASHSATS